MDTMNFHNYIIHNKYGNNIEILSPLRKEKNKKCHENTKTQKPTKQVLSIN